MIRLLNIGICFFALCVNLLSQNPGCVTNKLDTRLGNHPELVVEFPTRPGKDRLLVEAEKRYCREMGETPDLEAMYGFSHGATGGRVVRVFKDRVSYTHYESEARFAERSLSTQDLDAFRSAISTISFQTQGPLTGSLSGMCVDMCSVYEFFRVTRDGGTRIPIFAPYFDPPKPFDAVSRLFRKWESSTASRRRYYLSEQYPDAKILISDPRYSVRSFWRSGDDLRVLLQHRDVPADASPAWHSFSGESIAEQVRQPLSVPYLKDPGDQGCGNLMVINQYPFETRLGAAEICTGVGDKFGIWSIGPRGTMRLGAGEYSSPVVTPDQKWIIASKGDADKPIWRSIVRIDTITNAETRVDIAKADCLYPVSSVPGQKQVLIVRCKAEHTPKKNNPSPDKPEHYLFDTATGRAHLTKGEVRPLMHQDYRYLQPTENRDEFWAAIPDDLGDTEVGRYNVRSLSFTQVMTVPSIRFYSNDLWVDEGSATVYIVYGSELLSIPLRDKKLPLTTVK